MTNPVGTKARRRALRQEKMAMLSPTEREFALDGLDIAEEMAAGLRDAGHTGKLPYCIGCAALAEWDKWKGS